MVVLVVNPVLDATHCITCENASARTAEGIFEHTRSGGCEACWDVLVRDDLDLAATAKLQRAIAKPGGLRLQPLPDVLGEPFLGLAERHRSARVAASLWTAHTAGQCLSL